jgi:hypothetical protein
VDESVRGVPDAVEAFVELAAEVEDGEVVTGKRGAAGFAEFTERPVGGCAMLVRVKRQKEWTQGCFNNRCNDYEIRALTFRR